MFDSLFNYAVFLIPLAIFIFRLVGQARARNEAPSRIPVHFEDDQDDEPPAPEKIPIPVSGPAARSGGERYPYALSRGASGYFKDLAAQTVTVGKTKPAVPARGNLTRQKSAFPAGLPASGERKSNPPHDTVVREKGFPANLNRLSPLKQAVVMAEILGPPKGLL